MAVKTTSTQRVRTNLVKFTEATLDDLVDAYNTEEASLAADTDFTWTLTPIAFHHDGTNYNLIAYKHYPETETDPFGQLPTLP